MQRPTDEEVEVPSIGSQQRCGRPDCICALPIGERFVLWALRQWQFELTGWSDEEAVIALCGLAQLDRDGPLIGSLNAMVVPRAAPAAALRLKAFGVALGNAGLRISPPRGAPSGAATGPLH